MGSKIKRGKYKKLGNEKVSCFFCGNKTNSTLTLPDGSEVWCCERDAWIHGKVRRFRRIGWNYTPKRKSLKKMDKSLVEDKGNTVLIYTQAKLTGMGEPGERMLEESPMQLKPLI
jgi:transposase